MKNNFMQRAIDLAQAQNPHQISPNPRVGCVIVQDGKIISKGVTQPYGSSHAEAMALSRVQSLENCEIYVTLEPCDHFEGKQTPSCTQALIEAQPKKIIIGTLDPQFHGKNVKKLEAAGIQVEVLEDPECEAINPFFSQYITDKKPYLTLKVAQSLDGKITSNTKYITNELSRQKVHEMRAQYSAILTTTQTILADNPLLDVRLENHKYKTHPTIIILGKTELPKNLNIFQIPDRRILQFNTLEDFYESEAIGKIDSIMTECGTTMNDALLKQNLVDEVQLFTAPMVIGEGSTAFKNTHSLLDFKAIKHLQLEGDVLQILLKEES